MSHFKNPECSYQISTWGDCPTSWRYYSQSASHYQNQFCYGRYSQYDIILSSGPLKINYIRRATFWWNNQNSVNLKRKLEKWASKKNSRKSMCPWVSLTFSRPFTDSTGIFQFLSLSKLDSSPSVITLFGEGVGGSLT